MEYSLTLSLLALAGQQAREQVYRPKLEAVLQMAENEKAWIRKCQGPGGEIYLHGSTDVNPYFSCLAAQGLLSGQVKDADLDAAQSYIDWHCNKFLALDGLVPDYRISGGKEIASEPDSTDAYIAVFLSLICRKAELTNRLGDSERQALILGIERLSELLSGGLTIVRAGDDRCYYMDNLEVLEACQRVYRLSTQLKGIEELGNRAGNMAKEISAAMKEKLWNADRRCYEVGIRTGGQIIEAGDLKKFYPGGVVQVYGAFWGFPLSDRELGQELYARFCEDFEWETMKLPDTSFYWSELAVAAAEFGDLKRAEAYLEAYGKQIGEGREWPLHVGTAGWTAKACGQLAELYEERLDCGVLWQASDLLTKG